MEYYKCLGLMLTQKQIDMSRIQYCTNVPCVLFSAEIKTFAKTLNITHLSFSHIIVGFKLLTKYFIMIIL